MTDVLDTAITDGADYRGPSAQAWFAVGERVGYDPKACAIVAAQDAPLKTFLKREGEVSHAVTFLPGYPDGSFGWAKVRPHLPNAAEMPKLFVEYVGMGDSDKPKDYAYSTAERTDLVEALWCDLSVQSTTLVAFDFSSLVILEHLRRRLERSERGEPPGGPHIRGVFIFNGGLFTDGRSHQRTKIGQTAFRRFFVAAACIALERLISWSSGRAADWAVRSKKITWARPSAAIVLRSLQSR
jgi:pimeloyl-ACP methyl ester carboxylesterase